MKYKLLLFLLVLCTIHLNASTPSKGYHINICAPSFKGSTAYFASYWAGNPYVKDSIQIPEDGIFDFKGTNTLPTGQYLIYIKPDIQIEVLIDEKEQSDIKIELAKDDLLKSKVTGSKDTQLFWEYLAGLQQTNFNREEFLQKNQGSWFTSFIRYNQPSQAMLHPNPSNNEQVRENIAYMKEHFFDNISFTDERLWRTNFFIPMVNSYLEEVVIQSVDSIAKENSWIVKQTEPNKFCFEQMLNHLFSQATSSKVMGMENVWARLAEDYIFDKNLNWVDSTQYSNLLRDYSLIEHNRIGMKAQNLNLTTLEGDSINTNDIESKYTLLYFYSPTCSYCNIEIEKIKTELYPKYKDVGLKIVTINTSPDKDDWVKYIEQHAIQDWINLSDPNYTSQYWMKYDVSGTPSIYLLNKDKIIIAKKLNVENLDKYLSRFLNKE